MASTDAPARGSDHYVDDMRRSFENVISPPPVDVRAYLLDPPPTREEAARQARRRLLVRRGSIAGALVLAVALLAPWPSGGSPSDRAPQAQRASSRTGDTVAPLRVDVPAQRLVPARAAPDSARMAGWSPAKRPRQPAVRSPRRQALAPVAASPSASAPARPAAPARAAVPARVAPINAPAATATAPPRPAPAPRPVPAPAAPPPAPAASSASGVLVPVA